MQRMIFTCFGHGGIGSLQSSFLFDTRTNTIISTGGEN